MTVATIFCKSSVRKWNDKTPVSEHEALCRPALWMVSKKACICCFRLDLKLLQTSSDVSNTSSSKTQRPSSETNIRSRPCIKAWSSLLWPWEPPYLFLTTWMSILTPCSFTTHFHISFLSVLTPRLKPLTERTAVADVFLPCGNSLFIKMVRVSSILL